MTMHGFLLHPRLAADCHRLGWMSTAHLLLHRNAAIPWLILVPETAADNLLDLPRDQRDGVLADCERVAGFLRGPLACPKVNVAWIGNLVPQLHVHVIGRRPGDACWPDPVWGHLQTSARYSPAEVDRIRREILGAGEVESPVAKSRP
jgi:diadenosine tetraphosphate (Ap4A) HIT family hydrolase